MFLLENKYLPERMKSSCKKLYQLSAQSATIIIHFIVMAKIKMVSKNIYAVTAIINLPLINLVLILEKIILSVLFVVKLPSFTMILISILILDAVIKGVTMLCLFQSQLLSYLPLCQNLWVKKILNV